MASSGSSALRPAEDNNRLAALIVQVRNADSVDELRESLDALAVIFGQAGVPDDSRLHESAQRLIEWLDAHSTATALAEGNALAARLLHAAGAAEYLGLGDNDRQDIQKNIALWQRTAKRGAAATRRRRGSRATGSARSADGQVSAAREWARLNGYDVKERGRLPAAVVEAYEASQT